MKGVFNKNNTFFGVIANIYVVMEMGSEKKTKVSVSVLIQDKRKTFLIYDIPYIYRNISRNSKLSGGRFFRIISVGFNKATMGLLQMFEDH